MITSQQLALMMVWCPWGCWLTHDPHFNEGCNGYITQSVWGLHRRMMARWKGAHWSVGWRLDDALNKQWETGAAIMCNRCVCGQWLKRLFYVTQSTVMQTHQYQVDCFKGKKNIFMNNYVFSLPLSPSIGMWHHCLSHAHPKLRLLPTGTLLLWSSKWGQRGGGAVAGSEQSREEGEGKEPELTE